MAEYRAYLLDVDGHIFRRFELECDGDECALAAARQYVEGCDVEVWERARRVARLSRGGRPEQADRVPSQPTSSAQK